MIFMSEGPPFLGNVELAVIKLGEVGNPVDG
jgi:hypothetical protein